MFAFTPFPWDQDPGSDPGTARAIEDAGSVTLPNGIPVVGYGIADGLIDAPGDSDWFALDLTAGASCTFEVLGATHGGGDLADPVLTDYDTYGNPVAQNDDFVTVGPDGLPMVGPDGLPMVDPDPLLDFAAPTSGTYYLGVSGYGEATGSYAAVVTGDPGTIALPVYSGAPDDPDSPAWLFDLPSG